MVFGSHPNQHILINSSTGAVNGGNPHDFVNQYENAAREQKTKASVCRNVSILHVVPNMYPPTNMTVLLETNTGTGDVTEYPISVPAPTWYTHLTFAPAVQAAIAAIPALAATTVTISLATGRMTINSPVIPGFSWNIASIGEHPNLVPAYNLGFFMGAGTLKDTLLPAVLPNTINLAGPSEVLLSSRRVAHANGLHTDGHSNNVFCSINLTKTTFGSYASSETPDAKLQTLHYIEDRSLDVVDIQATDNLMNIIPLPDNANIAIDIVQDKVSVR